MNRIQLLVKPEQARLIRRALFDMQASASLEVIDEDMIWELIANISTKLVKD
jgi:hypothetical protein